MLSGWPDAVLELSCARCGRSGVFDVAELRSSLPGGDMALTFLRDHLTDGCVRRRATTSLTDLCQAELRVPQDQNGTPGE